MTTAWKERDEIGNTFWLRVIVWISRRCGRGIAQFFMWPTALYFFSRRGPERRASRLYLDRVLGRRALPVACADKFIFRPAFGLISFPRRGGLPRLEP